MRDGKKLYLHETARTFFSRDFNALPGAPSTGVVSILLATYNGAKFLDEQLASIENQIYPAIDIWVSDDGSTDATLEVLDVWRSKWSKGRFTILPGPCKGYAENFRSLIVNPDIISNYYGFADQDDIWEPDKIAKSVASIEKIPLSTPGLFCSRTLAITEDGETIAPSALFRRSPSFRNALAQSLAGGNTMLFNHAARVLLADASRRTGFVSHDWWIYLIVSGAGGKVRYSPEMLMRYRQHVRNQFGTNVGIMAAMQRLRLLFKGRLSEWTDLNLQGLERSRDLLTAESRGILDEFSKARGRGPLRRLYYFVRSGVYRQTALGQLGLYVAAVLGKI
ncbi:Glycosyltransferase involved in cell wall bisynthesis [Phyllobacterium sp. CL33Tsu]|nr:Glycosyltransferase involved in cell wall bisynthesis [Phyllobacterium sp. CL33Tsu]